MMFPLFQKGTETPQQFSLLGDNGVKQCHCQ